MLKITYVDENDVVIGHGNRKEAIEKGIIHRIARVFVFNTNGELLIQKRSMKVLMPGKWDQSAGGHVDEGESYATAAAREAEEEIGLKNAELKEVGKFYTEEIDGQSTKKRFNMLYTTNFDGLLQPDNDEVSEIRWVKPIELKAWMKQTPDDFTQGFMQTYQYYLSKR